MRSLHHQEDSCIGSMWLQYSAKNVSSCPREHGKMHAFVRAFDILSSRTELRLAEMPSWPSVNI